MVQWVSAGFRRENVRTLDWQTEDKSVKQFRKKGFTMDIILKLSEELGIKKSQAEAAVKLIDEGNTIPFIARYRKEVTGSLMMRCSVIYMSVLPISEILKSVRRLF